MGFVVYALFVPPKVETVYLDRPVTFEVIREVPKVSTMTIVVEKDTPVEKIVYQNLCYRQWESLQQFLDWYEARNFTVLIPNGDSLQTADCDNYAEWVAQEALEQGYLVSLALVDGQGKIYGIPVATPYHMGNLVVVGNEVFYVEPQPWQFRAVKITDLDEYGGTTQPGQTLPKRWRNEAAVSASFTVE